MLFRLARNPKFQTYLNKWIGKEYTGKHNVIYIGEHEKKSKIGITNERRISDRENELSKKFDIKFRHYWFVPINAHYVEQLAHKLLKYDGKEYSHEESKEIFDISIRKSKKLVKQILKELKKVDYNRDKFAENILNPPKTFWKKIKCCFCIK